MRKEGANPDRLIAQLAARQHGVVSTAQLGDAGLGDYAVSRRAKAGRLHRIHRGVYAVGHARLSLEGRCMAAVLACGGCAVISHRTAAALWGMLPPARGSIEITVPNDRGRRRRRGMRIHRSLTLAAGDVTRRSGVPLTRPLRTLEDVRRTRPKRAHQRALRRALDLRLVSTADLGPDPDLTRSELKRMFLRLCRRHRLPEPEVNARLGPHEVDFLWRDRSLIAETDGFRHHGGRAAFESDRSRDARLQARGYRVLRFTHRQVSETPEAVAASLRERLGPRR